jgi:hypothetical protein
LMASVAPLCFNNFVLNFVLAGLFLVFISLVFKI